jgi:3',5'-cyclic-AMP phosphodiesterase
VHISDTHFGPVPGYSLHGHAALPYAQRLVDSINDLPQAPDFVIHTGDVVTDPHPDAYALAAETLGRLRVPVYYVNGNHDSRSDIRKYFSMGSVAWLGDNPEEFSYAFELKGYRFLILDARGPTAIDPQGQLSAAQMKLVQEEAQPDGLPLVIFMHYPVQPLDSPWMDANMLVRNGDEFHQALLPARPRLRAVFHGHVHNSMQTIRDGILYVAVAGSLNQFSAWPSDEMVRPEPLARPGFNFVHLMPQQTIIHQHTFPRP